MTTYRYFQGPRTDMAGLADPPVTCTFCGSVGDGFELDAAICTELSVEEREDKHGCDGCLAAGRFAFAHNTDIGTLDQDGLRQEYANHQPAPANLRADALEVLLHTPDVARWQYEPWLTHCGDFMAFIGTWQPADFVRNAPDGDGRALFMKMTRDEDLQHLQHLWDNVCAEGEDASTQKWRPTYYVYRCLHCSELAGNWDSD